jgi:phage terminase large subunit
MIWSKGNVISIAQSVRKLENINPILMTKECEKMTVDAEEMKKYQDIIR